MKQKILLIGTLSNKKKNYVTGQSVIFDSVVDYFSEQNDVSVINTNDSGRFERGSIAFFIARIFQFFYIYIKLLWDLITRRKDVVYYQTALSAFGLRRDLIALRIISIFKVPVVAHQFGNVNIGQLFVGDEKSINRVSELAEKLNYIIVEGHSMVGEYQKYGVPENKIVVIPNGYKEEKSTNKKSKKYNQNEPFRLFYLSNLIFSKGYFDVLKAMDILVNNMKRNVTCCFSGKFYRGFETVDNDDVYGSKEAFDAFIKEHCLIDRIEYYPGLFGTDKADYFIKSNVFVLPTYYSGEGQPMSILEAMSYGCVPVVTAHGHISMMVNDDNGCLLEPKSPQSIAEAINTFIQNPDVYSAKSEKCIRDFEEKFTFQKFMESIDSVLSKTTKI